MRCIPIDVCNTILRCKVCTYAMHTHRHQLNRSSSASNRMHANCCIRLRLFLLRRRRGTLFLRPVHVVITPAAGRLQALSLLLLLSCAFTSISMGFAGSQLPRPRGVTRGGPLPQLLQIVRPISVGQRKRDLSEQQAVSFLCNLYSTEYCTIYCYL